MHVSSVSSLTQEIEFTPETLQYVENYARERGMSFDEAVNDVVARHLDD